MAVTQKTNRTIQKHVEHQDATNIQKNNNFFVFFGFFLMFYL